MKYILIFAGISFAFLAYFFFSGSDSVTNYPSSGTSVVAFGDSLVEGVGASEGNDFVAVLSRQIGEPIINLGKSGDTTKDALARMSQVVDSNPKIVIVLLGGNDYLKNVPAEETFSNLETIIEEIHASGAIVLLLGVRGGILHDGYESQFEDLAEKHNVAYVSDVLDGLIGKPGLMSDTIHPNDAGYKIIADRVYPVLGELLQ
ncbi:arylesterase [Candidatus Kaiserbacteria bacterium]|nr:arylesterase [Candidatus Kaiserbacteria bacterium]